MGEPGVLTHAVDSPEAFDESAHAAISFADHESPGWAELADSEPDGSGWMIFRSEKQRASRYVALTGALEDHAKERLAK